MVNIEAWAAGRPIVSGDIPAVRTLVRPGVDGFLVPVGDAGALSDRVGELLDDPRRARELGRNGRERVVEEFDWGRIVLRWDELLRSTVERVVRERSHRQADVNRAIP